MIHSALSTVRQAASTWREKRRLRAPEALRIWVGQKKSKQEMQ